MSRKPGLTKCMNTDWWIFSRKWLDPLDYPHEVNMSENIDAKAMRSKTESKDVVRAITGWYERLQINPEQKVCLDRFTSIWRHSLGFCAVESLAHVQRRPWLSVFELFANSCRWRSNYYWKKRHVGRYRRGTAFATIEITLFVAYWGSFPHPCSERKRRPYKPGESGSLSGQERRRRQRRRHLQSDHKEAVKWARRSFRSDFVLAVLRRRAQEKVRTVIAPRKIRMLTGSFIYSLVCSTRFSRTALTLKTFEYTWTA